MPVDAFQRAFVTADLVSVTDHPAQWTFAGRSSLAVKVAGRFVNLLDIEAAVQVQPLCCTKACAHLLVPCSLCMAVLDTHVARLVRGAHDTLCQTPQTCTCCNVPGSRLMQRNRNSPAGVWAC